MTGDLGLDCSDMAGFYAAKEIAELRCQRDELLALNAEALTIAKDALTWCSERDKYHIYSRELERIEAAIARARSGGSGQED